MISWLAYALSLFEEYQWNISALLFQLFRGNYDIYHTVTHRIIPPIKARFVRLHPRSWRSYIAIRVELYGCRARGEGLKINYKRSLLQHVYLPLVQSSSFLFFTIAARVNLNNFKSLIWWYVEVGKTGICIPHRHHWTMLQLKSESSTWKRILAFAFIHSPERIL